MKTLFLRGIVLLVVLLREIQKIFVNFHEWIFKRKELLKYKVSADLLEQERDILEGTNKFLTTGGSVSLTREEKGMLINAIEYKPFRDIIELPATKAQTRITWRELRKKLKLHYIQEIDDEVKEDDDTKQA